MTEAQAQEVVANLEAVVQLTSASNDMIAFFCGVGVGMLALFIFFVFIKGAE